jgi:hypothetical protein
MTTKTDAMMERLDAIVAQLEALTGPPGVPTTHLDASGNPGLVAAGELIESAWGNAVVTRVINRYPNQTALIATAPPSGTLAVTTDLGVVWIRDAGSWKPTALGNRVTFRAVGGGAGQNVPVDTLVQCTWASEVSDPFNVLSTGTFTAPWGGRWGFEWATEFAAGSAGTRQTHLSLPSSVRLGQDTRDAASGEVVGVTGAASALLTLGQTAAVVVYRTLGGGSQIVNPSTNQYFHGYYMGPY